MNHSAEIAAFVLARSNPSLDEIGDNVGLDEPQVKQLVGRLQAQGIVKRVNDRVLVDDKARAQTLALQADGDYLVKAAPEARRHEPPAAAANGRPVPAAAPAKPGPKERIPLATTVEIRSGVPLPPPRLGRVSLPCPWPLLKMEIGQMFEVAVPEGYEATDVANQVRKDIKVFDRLNPGRFFAVRTFENDAGKLAVGCWRESEAPVRGAHLKAPKPAATPPLMVPPPADGKIPVFARLVQPMGPDKGGRNSKAKR